MQKIQIDDRQNINLASVRDTLLPKLISGDLQVGEAARKLEEAL